MELNVVAAEMRSMSRGMEHVEIREQDNNVFVYVYGKPAFVANLNGNNLRVLSHGPGLRNVNGLPELRLTMLEAVNAVLVLLAPVAETPVAETPVIEADDVDADDVDADDVDADDVDADDVDADDVDADDVDADDVDADDEAPNVFDENGALLPGTPVLVDGKSAAVIRGAYPHGSTNSYSFPHYRVEFVGGNGVPAIVAMGRVTLDTSMVDEDEPFEYADDSNTVASDEDTSDMSAEMDIS